MTELPEGAEVTLTAVITTTAGQVLELAVLPTTLTTETALFNDDSYEGFNPTWIETVPAWTWQITLGGELVAANVLPGVDVDKVAYECQSAALGLSQRGVIRPYRRYSI